MMRLARSGRARAPTVMRPPPCALNQTRQARVQDAGEQQATVCESFASAAIPKKYGVFTA